MSGDMNINYSNISPADIQQLRDLYEITEKKDLVDVLMNSTIAQSPEQAVMLLYAMGIPVLPRPSEDGGISWKVNANSIASRVEAGFAKIGSDIWDSYSKYLQEQKERIEEYLHSPQYREKIEHQSPSYLEHLERKNPIDTHIQSKKCDGISRMAEFFARRHAG